jgi:hypothetical protein
LIQSISLAANQQARGSETIAQAMNDIADVTQQTAAGTKQAAVSISSLAVLADNLRNSVSMFKLPIQINHQDQNNVLEHPNGYNGGYGVLQDNPIDMERLLQYEESEITQISG